MEFGDVWDYSWLSLASRGFREGKEGKWVKGYFYFLNWPIMFVVCAWTNFWAWIFTYRYVFLLIFYFFVTGIISRVACLG